MIFSYKKAICKSLFSMSLPLFFIGCVQTKEIKNSDLVHYENYNESDESLSEDILKKNFDYCSQGKRQSPVDIIDIETKNNNLLEKLTPVYSNYPLHIWNNQHTIKVKFNKGEELIIGQNKFELLQFHFHTPSEHKINGKNTEMEIHFVHKNKAGEFAVIAVLIRSGKENIALKDLFNNLPKEDHTDVELANNLINPGDILPKNLDYYSYFGSLTTPPCVEKVHWYVLKNGIEVSPAQIQSFKNIFFHNAREAHSLNGRIIETKTESM